MEHAEQPPHAQAPVEPLDPHAMLLQRVALIERSLLKAGDADEKDDVLPQLKMLRERIKTMSGQYDRRFAEVRERNVRAFDNLSGLSEKLAQSHEGYGRVGGRPFQASCPPPAPSSGWHTAVLSDGCERRESMSSTACSTAESSRASSRDATPANRCAPIEMTPPRRWGRAGSDFSMQPSSRRSSDVATPPASSLANTPPTPDPVVQDTPSPPWPLWPEFNERVGSQIGSLLRLRPELELQPEWYGSPQCSAEEDLLLHQATSVHASPTSDPYLGAYDLPYDWGLC